MCDVTLTPPLRSVMLFPPLALVRYILSQLGLEDRWLDGVWLFSVYHRSTQVKDTEASLGAHVWTLLLISQECSHCVTIMCRVIITGVL